MPTTNNSILSFKMKISNNLTSTLLILTSFFCVHSAPAKPLNERSTEFAWVILDEQQNDSSLRRKITPKSIFISPSFGFNCGSGYTLDSNGRCIKVVKLNTSAHEAFLLQKLNQEFGNYEDYDDDEDDDETLPTPGPFQFNIPLNMDVDRNKGISIIVAPTNGQFEDTLKLEEPEKRPNDDVPLIITKITIDENDEDDATTTTTTTTRTRTTTENVQETTTTEPVITTIQEQSVETTTTQTETEVPSTTYPTTTKQVETTTMLEMDGEPQQAIFFKVSTEIEDTMTTATTTTTTESPTSTIHHPNAVRFPVSFDETLFREFLNGENINRRFVVKQDVRHEEDAIYQNHRNRDRWLFPRLSESGPISTPKSAESEASFERQWRRTKRDRER